MTDADLCRDNILHTYLQLATALDGVHVTHGENYDSCTSDVPLALCNFAINFHGQSVTGSAIADELVQLSRTRPVFRVFLCDGDQPNDLSHHLQSNGMIRFAHLSSLICRKEVSTTIELEPCSDSDTRVDAATFMVSNFFWRRETYLRNKIVQSTSASPHRLYRVQNNKGRTVAAVMVTESTHACGLYNLCVEPKARNQGLGSQIVHACLEISNNLGKPLTLQAEASLANWYANLGFIDVARVETLGISPKTWR